MFPWSYLLSVRVSSLCKRQSTKCDWITFVVPTGPLYWLHSAVLAYQTSPQRKIMDADPAVNRMTSFSLSSFLWNNLFNFIIIFVIESSNIAVIFIPSGLLDSSRTNLGCDINTQLPFLWANVNSRGTDAKDLRLFLGKLEESFLVFPQRSVREETEDQRITFSWTQMRLFGQQTW